MEHSQNLARKHPVYPPDNTTGTGYLRKHISGVGGLLQDVHQAIVLGQLTTLLMALGVVSCTSGFYVYLETATC